MPAAALSCGAYEISLEGDTADPLPRALMADLLPGQGTPAELEQICVLHRVNAAFPPVFLMTCSGDFLSGQAPLLQQRLQAAGVPHVLRYYTVPGGEPLGHVFHLNIRTPEARRCSGEEAAFFLQTTERERR